MTLRRSRNALKSAARLLAACAFLSFATGCQYRYTGEISVYPIRAGDLGGHLDLIGLADLGVPGPAFATFSNTINEQRRVFPDTKLMEGPDRTLSISINRAFVKYLADIDANKELLAFVEVKDHADGKTYKRVFFDDEFVAEGAYLNFSNATVYGPRVYRGYPITVSFYVVELDQKENAVALEVVQQLKQTVAMAGAQVAPVSSLLFDFLSALIRANVDDREMYFVQEFTPATTLSPTPADARSAGAVLQTGNFVVVKQEFDRNGVSPAALIPFEDELSWPYWLDPTEALAGSNLLPNIIYFGGQLYVHRSFSKSFDQSEETRRLASGIAQRLFENRQRTVTRIRSDLSMFRAKSMAALKTQASSIIDDLKYDPRARAWFDSNSGSNIRPKGGSIDMTEPPASQPPASQPPASRTSALAVQNYLLGNYERYSSKSYLSMTIADDRSPAIDEVIAAEESSAAARIGDVVLTLSLEQQRQIVRDLGGSLRSTVVQTIARSEFRGINDGKLLETKRADLEKRFGDAFKRDLELQAADRLSKIKELKRMSGAPSSNIADLRAAVKERLPMLRQLSPQLATFAELLFMEHDSPAADK
ncbi:MAG: hypothetical protein ACKVS9_09215 [Phycisphaerae bacterium]